MTKIDNSDFDKLQFANIMLQKANNQIRSVDCCFFGKLLRNVDTNFEDILNERRNIFMRNCLEGQNQIKNLPGIRRG